MAFSFKSKAKNSMGGKEKFALVSFDALADLKKIVYFAGVLFTGVLIWSGYLFWSIQSSGPSESAQADAGIKSAQAVEKGLVRISELYTKKGDTFEFLLTNIPVVVDPAK